MTDTEWSVIINLLIMNQVHVIENGCNSFAKMCEFLSTSEKKMARSCCGYACQWMD